MVLFINTNPPASKRERSAEDINEDNIIELANYFVIYMVDL